MKKHILFLTGILVLPLSSNPVYSAQFELRWKSGSDEVIAAFTGTATGNIITNIGNISVWLDGTPFTGNGALYSASYDAGSNWVDGNAQVSFDGSENNFFFGDANPAYTNWTNGFGDINLNLPGSNFAQIGRPTATAYFTSSPADYSAANYSISQIPEPASLALLVSGVLGFRLSRGKMG